MKVSIQRLSALILLSIITQTTFAQTLAWTTGCHTILSVADYRDVESSVYLGIDPPLPGCNWGGVSRIRFKLGANGVTAEGMKGALALGMLAYTTKKQVKLFYDTSSAPVCNTNLIAIGGGDNTCN
jgi:hypothetical protein